MLFRLRLAKQNPSNLYKKSFMFLDVHYWGPVNGRSAELSSQPPTIRMPTKDDDKTGASLFVTSTQLHRMPVLPSRRLRDGLHNKRCSVAWESASCKDQPTDDDDSDDGFGKIQLHAPADWKNMYRVGR